MSKNVLLVLLEVSCIGGLIMALVTGCESGGSTSGEETGGITNSWDFGSNNTNVYVAMGDSVTEGIGGDGATYPAILSQMLGKTVINAGESGKETGDGVTREGSLLSEYKPGHLLIVYVMDDEGLNPAHHAEIMAHLQTIVEAAKANKTIPVLATQTPRYGDHASFEPDAMVLDSQIRNLATQENVPLADLASAFGTNQALISADGIHPDAAGYKVIAQTFFNVLTQ